MEKKYKCYICGKEFDSYEFVKICYEECKKENDIDYFNDTGYCAASEQEIS